MLDRSYFEMFDRDRIVVTRTQGAYSAAGYTADDTSVILRCDGTAQQVGHVLQAQQAHYATGDLLFFCAEDATHVRPADTVQIETRGEVLDGTVEAVNYDDNSLLISL
jgi:hypothetical protein